MSKRLPRLSKKDKKLPPKKICKVGLKIDDWKIAEIHCTAGSADSGRGGGLPLFIICENNGKEAAFKFNKWEVPESVLSKRLQKYLINGEDDE